MSSIHEHDLSPWVRHDRARHVPHPQGGEHADGLVVAESKTHSTRTKVATSCRMQVCTRGLAAHSPLRQ
jgi:hypothetical protein